MKEKPIEATHYSPSMDAYFHWDNALFIWAGEWVEYLNTVNDLIKIPPN